MNYPGNGCGPKGLVGKLIPDSLFGLPIREACNLHDVRYLKGGNSEDRKGADQKFLNDLLSKIQANDSSYLLHKIRKIGAYLYYFSVRFFGHFFFKK